MKSLEIVDGPAVSFGAALDTGLGIVVAAVAPEAVALGTVSGATAGLTVGAAVEATRIRTDAGEGARVAKAVALGPSPSTHTKGPQRDPPTAQDRVATSSSWLGQRPWCQAISYANRRGESLTGNRRIRRHGRRKRFPRRGCRPAAGPIAVTGSSHRVELVGSMPGFVADLRCGRRRTDRKGGNPAYRARPLLDSAAEADAHPRPAATRDNSSLSV